MIAFNRPSYYRVLSPPASTVLSDNSPPCTTFCSYTTPIPDNDARPLKRQGMCQYNRTFIQFVITSTPFIHARTPEKKRLILIIL
jgi:hypothetical protein